jgi:hypothetical protein
MNHHEQASSTPAEGKPEKLVFRSKEKIAWKVTVAFGGAFLSLVFFVGVFLLDLLLDIDSYFTSALAGVTVLGIISGVGYGIYLLRRPLKVVLNGDGIQTEGLIGGKSIPWDAIAEVQRRKADFSLWMHFHRPIKDADHVVVLNLLGEGKKKLASFMSDFPNFESLANEIIKRSSAARGGSTYDREKHVAEILKDQKRKRVLLPLGGAFLVVMGAVGLISSYRDHVKEQRMKDEGVVVEATVIRLWKYNVTPWVEYLYQTTDGRELTDKAMMERRAWEGLEEGHVIRVRYDPLEPERSELLFGQKKGKREPPAGLFVFAAGFAALVGLFLLAMPVFGISDVKVTKGKIRFIRYGEIDEEQLPPEPRETVVAPPLEGEETLLSEEEVLTEEIAAPREVSDVYAKLSAQAGPEARVAPSKPPRGIMAFTVLNVLFGMYGILLHTIKALAAIWIFTTGAAVEHGDEMVVFDTGTTEFALSMSQHIVGFLLAVLLLISAIGLYRFRVWGAKLAVFTAWGQLLLGVVLIIVRLFFQGIEGAGEEVTFTFNIARAFGIFMVLLGMIYPLAIVLVLGRKATKRVFPDYEEA